MNTVLDVEQLGTVLLKHLFKTYSYAIILGLTFKQLSMSKK